MDMEFSSLAKEGKTIQVGTGCLCGWRTSTRTSWLQNDKMMTKGKTIQEVVQH